MSKLREFRFCFDNLEDAQQDALVALKDGAKVRIEEQTATVYVVVVEEKVVLARDAPELDQLVDTDEPVTLSTYATGHSAADFVDFVDTVLRTSDGKPSVVELVDAIRMETGYGRRVARGLLAACCGTKPNGRFKPKLKVKNNVNIFHLFGLMQRGEAFLGKGDRQRNRYGQFVYE